MNGLLEQLAADPWGRLALHYVAAGGIRQSFLFAMWMDIQDNERLYK